MRRFYAVTLATLLTLCTTGCAGLSGNAVYKYQKVGEDCSLTVDTGRVLAAGIAVQLIDCDVTVDAGKVEKGGNSIKDVVDLLGLLNPAPVPK